MMAEVISSARFAAGLLMAGHACNPQTIVAASKTMDMLCDKLEAAYFPERERFSHSCGCGVPALKANEIQP